MKKNLRLQALQHKLSEKDVVIMVKSEEINTENVRYFSDFSGTEGTLVISKEKCIFVLDGRYADRVKKESPYFEIVNISGLPTNPMASMYAGLQIALQKVANKNSIFNIVQPVIHDRQVLIERVISDLFQNAKVVAKQDMVESIILVKTKKEKKIIQKWQSHVDFVIEKQVPKMLRKFKNLTEKILAQKIEILLRKEGEYDLSFGTIVCFGENSALPHHSPSERKLKANENILIDCGVRKDGWCTDMTRNFWFGSTKSKKFLDYKKKYDFLLKIQMQATQKYAGGEQVSEADRFVRDSLGEDAKYFIHSLGHGFGLNIHEAPRVFHKSSDNLIFVNGSIISNEPGIYIPNKFGIRIEDAIYINDKNPEVLTKCKRELIIVK